MMDANDRRLLLELIRHERVAALGTLHDGAPLVSQLPCAAAPDLSAFYLHVSRLAWHTQDILQDARVCLMFAAADCDPARHPQTLPRVSIIGTATEIARDAPHYAAAEQIYLAKFPQTAFNFQLGDFSIFTVTPHAARYVAGFGKIYNLSAEELRRIALA